MDRDSVTDIEVEIESVSEIDIVSVNEIVFDIESETEWVSDRDWVKLSVWLVLSESDDDSDSVREIVSDAVISGVREWVSLDDIV